MVLRLIPFVIASVLLSAHFLREGNIGLMLVSILVPLFLLIRRRWILIALQLWSYLAAIIWMNTMIDLVQQRMMAGRSWGTAVIILGSVSLFTIFAGALLNSRVLEEKFPRSRASR
ncbi:hypothetical protein [Desulfomonile tiedjei]|uniref:Uncharacterized protein n=1 Tax=Desulfomonile tiedjei (strain ATCC 49306 / DSM 6799 / DCB-1) TaxID=706587 RepID=I4CAL4_DESTA|nr:hypothetical protein [Desulfomonile tiedjei]AFM26605.1 hypothetical protein Desti_3963 [Desulfomonile tiedjei DSM 6799]